jgi:hypothetical protein
MSLLTACGGAPDTPTGPSSAVETPPAPMTGIVQGLVRSEGYFTIVLTREAQASSRLTGDGSGSRAQRGVGVLFLRDSRSLCSGEETFRIGVDLIV